MGLATRVVTSDGVTLDYEYNFTLGLLNISYLHVYQRKDYQSPTEAVLFSTDPGKPGWVKLVNPVPIGYKIIIRRETPEDYLTVEFKNGRPLDAARLTTGITQTMMVANETRDLVDGVQDDMNSAVADVQAAQALAEAASTAATKATADVQTAIATANAASSAAMGIAAVAQDAKNIAQQADSKVDGAVAAAAAATAAAQANVAAIQTAQATADGAASAAAAAQVTANKGVSDASGALQAANLAQATADSAVTVLNGDTLVKKNGSTGAAAMPVGTTAQRPSGVVGHFRYNSDIKSWEGYNGTMWGSVGGGAKGGGSDQIFFENDLTMNNDYTTTAGKGAHCVGPLKVNATLTVGDGGVLVIL